MGSRCKIRDSPGYVLSELGVLYVTREEMERNGLAMAKFFAPGDAAKQAKLYNQFVNNADPTWLVDHRNQHGK